MGDVKSISVTRLIVGPALITLAVTILRLAGELKHWPAPWFSNAAGGGGALVGISWLPIIFGPYFALKLADAGDAPGSQGKVLGFGLAGLAVFILGGALFAFGVTRLPILSLLALLVMLAALLLPRHAWPTLGNVLIAYAFAARVPVVIVMYIAMRANGGAGWGTHYDAVAPALAHVSFAKKFFEAAILPQFTLWISWTVIVGTIFGALVMMLTRRPKQSAPAAV